MKTTSPKKSASKIAAAKIEQKLNKISEINQKQFQNILLHSPNIFIILEGFPEMIITFANEPLYKSWGKTAAIIGKSLMEVVPEIKDQTFPALLQQVFETGKTHYSSEERAVIDINGNPFDKYYNYVYQPIFNDTQKVTGVTVMATDITELVFSRKKMEESETLFRLALFLTAKTVFKQDTQLRYTWIYNTHPSFEMKDLLGKTDREILNNDAAEILTTIKQTVLNTGKTFTGEIELEINGKAGEFTIRVEATKDSAGKINGIIAVSEDITEKKQVEKKITESEKQNSYLLKLSDALRSFGNPIEIEGTATKIAMNFMEADRCYYCTREEGNAIILRDAFGEGLTSLAAVYAVSDFTDLMAAIDSGNPFVIDDVQNSEIVEEGLKQMCMQVQVLSMINVPVIKNGKTVGVFVLAQSKPRKWTKEEVKLCVETTERIWTAVERAKTEEALYQSEEKYRTLFTSINQGYTQCELIRSKEGKGVDLTILEVNPTYEQQTGIKKEMVIGKPLLQVFPSLDKWLPIYVAVVDNQQPAEFENYFEETDRWFAIKVYPLIKDRFAVLFSDITSQKQASQYARSLIEASLDPLVTINADGKITDVNEASIKVTGVEREKLIDTDFSNYFTEPEKAQEGYQQVFEKGFVADYPLTIKHKNGNLTDVLYNASVYKDDNGNVLGVFAAARDVTEQKQASQYARSLIEASLDPLVTINADGKITDVNEASIKVTGVEREKLIDTDFSNYFTEPEKAQEGYQQVFEKSFVADYPLTIKHKNGNLTDVLYNASVYKDDKGNVLGVFAAARDVTARKKAEEKIKESELEVRKIKEQLELSITAGKIGVWHWDVKNDLLYWSNEQKEMYGFSASEVITSAAQVNHLIIPEDLKRIQVDENDSNKIDYEHNFRIIRKSDGELRWIKSRARNTFDSQGAIQYISGINIDVTEQMLFEKELIDAKTSAENATKSKQQFLSNMSHEIRTPLNSIIGFTNVLMKTELSLRQKEFVEAINTSGKSLNLLVNDILDLAKVDAGKMTFETQPFEIRKSITSILHSFDMKIKEKNLELVEEYDNKMPSILVGDSLRLNQIILNLISNAVKFTHKGKIKLTIKLLHEDKENVTIEFVVSDSGIGIPDNKLNSIFNLFEQAEINTSTSYGGTGLGLSIVKQLVEGQGGSVSVKSKLGEGSAFSFTLSFGKTNLKLEEDIVLINPNSEIKTLQVLVAEDVPLNQFLIKIILNDFGFEYEIVGNGKLAIEKMQTNIYDIILMDLQMPEMNGYEATEYIRKTLKSQIPIIALTADVTTADVSKCKELGMDDYISKPIEENLLYSKIVELVKKNK